eukprot:TRINITY_DN5194_c1_g1_i1.p1 TRINITY_DN5194_c1_g1~~TRINITY_DN5194_c1_g1_i1.p1  ORF type:complete len:234 (-),score=56.88 TRINITY_DN5194_c1_g1_i1:305-1006(-)
MFSCFRRRGSAYAKQSPQQQPADVHPTLLASGDKGPTELKHNRRSVVVAADLQHELDNEEARAAILLRQAAEAEEMDQEELQQEKPLVALVAHDNMSQLMATFIRSYQHLLGDFRLVGPAHVCQALNAVGIEAESYTLPSGPMGGDQILGKFIVQGKVKAVFCFKDPLSTHVNLSDTEALSRLSDLYQVFFASNYRTAAATLETLHDHLTRMSTLPSHTVAHNHLGVHSKTAR